MNIIHRPIYFFRGGNAYGSDKNTVQQDIEKMKAKEEELDNLIYNTGMNFKFFSVIKNHY